MPMKTDDLKPLLTTVEEGIGKQEARWQEVRWQIARRQIAINQEEVGENDYRKFSEFTFLLSSYVMFYLNFFKLFNFWYKYLYSFCF